MHARGLCTCSSPPSRARMPSSHLLLYGLTRYLRSATSWRYEPARTQTSRSRVDHLHCPARPSRTPALRLRSRSSRTRSCCADCDCLMYGVAQQPMCRAGSVGGDVACRLEVRSDAVSVQAPHCFSFTTRRELRDERHKVSRAWELVESRMQARKLARFSSKVKPAEEHDWSSTDPQRSIAGSLRRLHRALFSLTCMLFLIVLARGPEDLSIPRCC